jgi:hypothetical protein
LKQSSKNYANAEFSSAEGSRTFASLLNTLLKQSSKNYANAEFSSAEGSRTFGAFYLHPQAYVSIRISKDLFQQVHPLAHRS